MRKFLIAIVFGVLSVGMSACIVEDGGYGHQGYGYGGGDPHRGYGGGYSHHGDSWRND